MEGPDNIQLKYFRALSEEDREEEPTKKTNPPDCTSDDVDSSNADGVEEEMSAKEKPKLFPAILSEVTAAKTGNTEEEEEEEGGEEEEEEEEFLGAVAVTKALQKAAKKNNLSEVKRLLKHRSADNSPKAASVLLVLASEYGSYETVEYLLDTPGVNVNYRLGKELRRKLREESKLKCGDGDCALHVAAYNKHASVVELLLQQPGVDVYAADGFGRNVLMHAAFVGDPDIVQQVLNKMEEVEKGDNKKLKERLNTKDNKGYTALRRAVHKRHTETIRVLMRTKAKSLGTDITDIDINAKDEVGDTILMYAVITGSLETVKVVINKIKTSEKNNKKVQEILNQTDKDGWTALHWAARGGHEELCRVLLEADVDPSVKNEEDCTALLYAVRSKLKEVVEMLLARPDANVCEADKTGKTTLMYARQWGDEDIITKIVEKMKEIKGNRKKKLQDALNQLDKTGSTALHCAAKEGHLGLLKLLLDVADNAREDQKEPTVVNAKDGDGFTALMYAVKNCEQEMITTILKYKGVDVNVRNHDGRTALMMAIELHNATKAGLIARSLTKTDKFNVNIKNNEKQSALLLAHQKGYTKITKLLVSKYLHKIDISDADSDEIRQIIEKEEADNNSVWPRLLKGSPIRVFPLLLLMLEKLEQSNDSWDQTGFWSNIEEKIEKIKRYCKINQEDGEGNTLFHYCAAHENGAKLFPLLFRLFGSYQRERARGTPHWAEKNNNKETILHTAMKNKKTKIYDALMRYHNEGTETTTEESQKRNLRRKIERIINEENIDGNTFLAIAIKANNFTDQDIIQMMDNLPPEQLRPLCVATDRDRNTILHLAATFSRDDLIKYLSTKPVETTKLNIDGHTALHVAVQNNNVETVKRICESFKHRDMDINQRTSTGETALHIAAKKGATEMMNVLVKLGADYAAQDEDGHTPLHDVLQIMHLETDEKHEGKENHLFKNVWKATVNNCVVWWCKKRGMPVPDEDSEIRRKAMYHLRSEIPNNNELTVLAYAATLDLDEPIQTMLTEKNVFVIRENDIIFKRKSKEKRSEYVLDVSGLTPEYSDENSFLEELSRVDRPVNVNRVLGSFPMEKLAKYQWYFYQCFYLAYLLFHMFIMMLYTYNAPEMPMVGLNSSNSSNGTSLNESGIETSPYDIFMALYYNCAHLYWFMLWWQSVVNKRRQKSVGKKSNKKKCIRVRFPEYVEAKGAVLNGITYAVALFVENLNDLILYGLSILSILLVLLVEFWEGLTQEYYAWISGLNILLGWLVIVIISRAYSPIYKFVIALKYIFIKDMVPFLLFFFFLTIAFGCAIQLQFQLLSAETIGEYGNEWLISFLTSAPEIMMELFIIAVGMDTDIKNVQNVGHMFQQAEYSSFFIELLLVIYALIVILILLNVLIAAMSTTYAEVTESQGKGWRQYQVKLAIMLRNRSQRILDGCVRCKTRAIRTTGGRWYIPISPKNLKTIKVKYWNVFQEENDVVEERNDKDFEHTNCDLPNEITSVKNELKELRENTERFQTETKNELKETKNELKETRNELKELRENTERFQAETAETLKSLLTLVKTLQSDKKESEA